jgi:Tfp pilus assembly protein PilF
MKGAPYEKGGIVIEGIDIGKQYLVLIAIDEYAEWKDLTNPVRDAKRLKEVLTEYYHFNEDEVIELYNRDATKKAIFKCIKEFGKNGKRKLAFNDTLFIYHSGHGYMDKITDKGYWIPHDGSNVNSKMSRANWLDNSELIGLIRNIQSHHILIASDSCFAGTLVDKLKGTDFVSDDLKVLNTIYPIKGRKVLTAGADEWVSDNSLFANLLIDELKMNEKKNFIMISSIYSRIEKEIIRKTGNSIKGNRPLYGDIKGVLSRAGSHIILFTKEGRKNLVDLFTHNRNPPVPGSAEFFLKEGIAYLAEGNLKMAEKALKKALKKKRDLVAAINKLGIIYYKKEESEENKNEKFEKAKKAFERVIELAPDYFEAYNYLGLIYIEKEEYESARKYLLKAAKSEKNPTPEYAYFNLADIEMRRGNLEQALRYVNQGITKNTFFAALYNLKGMIFEKLKEYDKSIYNYQKASKSPYKGAENSVLNDATYLINLGRVYARIGEKVKALDTLEKALVITKSSEQKKQINALIKHIKNE